AAAAGEIDAFIGVVSSVLGQVQGGLLRAIGVTSAEPLPVLPDVRPMGDAAPGYVMTSWFGMMVPAKTPRPIIDRLSKAVVAALMRPEVKASYSATGDIVVGSTPDEMQARLSNDLVLMSNIAKTANLKLQ